MKDEKLKSSYKKSDNTEIIELLEIIQEKNQNYNDWIRVGIALHTTNNNEEMRGIWKEWSETNYKFKPKQFDSLEEEINYKWESFKEEQNPLTIGTIKKPSF